MAAKWLQNSCKIDAKWMRKRSGTSVGKPGAQVNYESIPDFVDKCMN